MASALVGPQVNGTPNGGARHGSTTNGSKQAPPHYATPKSKRFSDIPSTIDIPVQDQDDEAVEIDLEVLADDPTELCTLFEMEHAARTYWMTVALAYAKQRKIDFAIEMLIRGANAMQINNPREKLSIVTCLCWMYLWKSREAPRVAPEGSLVSEAKTKEYYLQLATQSLNEASRINPAFPPLFLARGVLYLLKASLQAPSKAAGAGDARGEQLRAAIKSFEDALKRSNGKNMLAVMGRARALFSLGKPDLALAGYQEALAKMPDLVDPDPRIGIGCCFWQLGYKDDAKLAWERSLEISPNSKVANILLGVYYLDSSGRVPTKSDEFTRLYTKAMTEYTQTAYKLDKDLPLTCATFAGYFLSRRKFNTVDSLAHKAIQYTDVNAIASDGWFLLARKAHHDGDLDRASDYYRRADDARGGANHGYLPAKFGAAQLSVLKNDLGEAKLQLEKILQNQKNYEAMTLLGILYAEEVFANQYAAVKEDKTAEAKKAIGLLESVRAAWKDPNKNLSPDSALLLNLARLYENESPDRALACLQQVEKLELDRMLLNQPSNSTDPDDEAARRNARQSLPPQLLNNMGCFYYQDEKHELASEMFEAALESCVRIDSTNENVDTDALITTISFNLGRSYEARGNTDKAVEAYEGLLQRHSDYTDARARLAYIKLRKQPNKEGPDAVAKLYQENPSDLEVRALYGWFLGKIDARKRPANPAEDPEQRHFKHTLQNYDKHDRYALVGMGNKLLTTAREMRRETDQDKQKRSAAYTRAVEFFEKALQLDPKNAYAAQGIAIALAEDKKDLKNALQVFVKVRETLRESSVFINLGHTYAELKQFTKAIESYEMALSKEGKATDVNIISCLARTWLNKGRADHSLDAYGTALDYAKKALVISPEQLHFKFNVAFAQIQLAMTIHGLNETQRTSAQLEDASEGLEAAIKALDEIAAANQPPYPKHDIEQRANMARNTQRKQLERALASQREYEEKNKEKLAAALKLRQAELRRREEEKRKVEELERERQEKIKKEREEIAARDRALAEQRAEEERARADAEMTTDSETGDKIKRKRKTAPRSSAGEPKASKSGRSSRRKKAAADTDGGEGSGDDDREHRRPPKKKQRLTSRKDSNKYKSAEIVVDSSDEEGGDALDRAERALERQQSTPGSASGSNDDGGSRRRTRRRQSASSDRMDVDQGDYAAGSGRNEENDDDDDDAAETLATRRSQPKRPRRGRIVDDDESDEEDTAGNAQGAENEDAPTPGTEGGSEDRTAPVAAAAADTSMADEDDE
ncbi:hypothetical protein B0T24DRAFT_556962 [Lasiosphaeria ovina]|uniref:Tetratricopeptide repeat protein 1 n=1 Tax=Lasiosphaeria ovina TaxID=92902 RepID=A0AAE0K419_9PEZI|nr:hypothetical protein B0T24DRAFT_556962 [Lasiosphaeria ovina]